MLELGTGVGGGACYGSEGLILEAVVGGEALVCELGRC